MTLSDYVNAISSNPASRGYVNRLDVVDGAINDTAGRVTVILDAGLMSHETINAHPLVNTMTTSIARDDLLAFLKATGHEPRIVTLDQAGVESPEPG